MKMSGDTNLNLVGKIILSNFKFEIPERTVFVGVAVIQGLTSNATVESGLCPEYIFVDQYFNYVHSI